MRDRISDHVNNLYDKHVRKQMLRMGVLLQSLINGNHIKNKFKEIGTQISQC